MGLLRSGITDDQKIREILQIAENETIVAVIAVGYGDIDPAKPKRKQVADIAKYY